MSEAKKMFEIQKFEMALSKEMMEIVIKYGKFAKKQGMENDLCLAGLVRMAVVMCSSIFSPIEDKKSRDNIIEIMMDEVKSNIDTFYKETPKLEKTDSALDKEEVKHN